MTHQINRHSRSKKKRTGLAVASAATSLFLLISVGYTVAAATAPLPDLEVTLSVAESSTYTAPDDAIQKAVSAQALPTALSWEHLDKVWSNDDQAYPLASISKVVTVLVALDAQPLEEDPATWPDLELTYDDVMRQEEYKAFGGVAYPMPIGTAVALEDVFHLIFLPSANGFAAAYAYSVFGTNDNFVDAVSSWAARQGLDSLHLIEPTGMEEANVANVSDIVKIGRLALENPIISRFIQIKEANIPGAGEIENTNPLLGEDPNVVGIKTGSTYAAGFNLLVAAKQQIGDREVTRISVTLGRGSLEERAQSGRDMLATLSEMPQDAQVLTSGDVVGQMTGWRGETTDIFITENFSTVLLPTETVSTTLKLDIPEGALDGKTVVGEVTATTPTETVSVPLAVATAIEEPDLLWRIMNPQKLWFQK